MRACALTLLYIQNDRRVHNTIHHILTRSRKLHVPGVAPLTSERTIRTTRAMCQFMRTAHGTERKSVVGRVAVVNIRVRSDTDRATDYYYLYTIRGGANGNIGCKINLISRRCDTTRIVFGLHAQRVHTHFSACSCTPITELQNCKLHSTTARVIDDVRN